MEVNIWHVLPQNDLKDHQYYCDSDWWFEVPVCHCECKPKIVEVDGGFVVVHNAYDGREGLEWTNEILNS